ncbi:sigma-54 dependent transcriptional regulator [Thiorhodococcus minor]|uniref:Sigma-54-dependent Fis family transcriptional regulator n=1 Tax=Thiorhodococcus minor TaxID=57489 RepID=A0A6M0JVX2_9GAMM|nr:sigma-54 dependent transcriptional regulator [Thiorhodococcus minor]NEV60467.1 sigma-54-dependent Fis family transcriptional regulator [Thiorhodococcus minor]
MRELLVVSKDDLTDDIARFLSENGWSLCYARSPETASKLADERKVLVGVVLFPTSRDTRLSAQLQQTVAELPQVKWIAALTEQMLSEREIKHFVAEHLYDFHVYPLEGERLTTVLGHAYGMARLERELAHHQEIKVPSRFGLVGESPQMRHLYRMLQRAAESDVSVLITGPTGTGKELAARAIHDHSERADGPYVAINCAAIPPSLLQSELFGHEKGSFTSANARKSGYIQSAAGGTLFLDEIGDMPMESQATLLRFLEDKIVTPIGSTRGKHIDVRILASTNVDLEGAIQNKRFRADLYYRLAFLTVETPALSERGKDIELLARHFLDEVTRDAGTRQLKIGQDALATLLSYAWPGNVRELRSVIFQAALSCEGLTIQASDLKIQGHPRGPYGAHGGHGRDAPEKHNGASAGHYVIGTLKSAREESEKRNLEYALERNACNITRTAQDLGVSRMTLYRLMAKHGVERSAIESSN